MSFQRRFFTYQNLFDQVKQLPMEELILIYNKALEIAFSQHNEINNVNDAFAYAAGYEKSHKESVFYTKVDTDGKDE